MEKKIFTDEGKIEMVNIFNELYSVIRQNTNEWRRFLDFSTNIYKYSFDNALLAYPQSQQVTALASESVWEKVGRGVNENAQAIVVTNLQGKRAFEVRELFDVSQTYGKLISFNHRKFDEEAYKALAKTWNLTEDGDIHEKLRLVLMKRIKQTVPANTLLQNSVYYMIQHRLGLRGKPLKDKERESLRYHIAFSDVKNIGSLEQFVSLGNAVFNHARPILVEIESWKQNFDKERELNNDNRKYQRENNLRDQERRPKISTDQDGEHQREEASRRVRESNTRLPSRKSAGEVSLSHHVYQFTSVPTGNRVRSNETANELGERNGKANSSTSQQQSTSHHTIPQSDSHDSERSSDEGVHSNTEIVESNTNRKETSDKSEVSFFTEDQFDLFTQSMEETEEKAGTEKVLTNVAPTVEIETPPTKKGTNYYRDEENSYPKGPKSKFVANIEAIKLVQDLEISNRQATLAEQQVLAKYTGWGGLQDAFDPTAEAWKEEYKQLKELVSDDVYEAARSTVLTAYYTEPFIIEEIYRTLEENGFTGGEILDPSMGTGNFFSKLPENLRDSELHGVELDPLTGKIAKHLYPGADIQIKGFEATHFKEGSFDLIISNIPFGDFDILDKNLNGRYKIHDYFMQKSARLLKPGGVMAFITTTGSMDKKDAKTRIELSEQLDLVAGVRLPSNIFRQVGGTSVTSDLLFFQKKKDVQASLINQDGENRRDLPAWISPQQIGENVWRNEYFVNNTSNILGDIRIKNFHGQTEEVFVKDYDKEAFQQRLRLKLEEHPFNMNVDKAVQELTDRATTQTENIITEQSIARKDERCFTYQLVNSSIYYVEKDSLEKKDITGKAAERIKGMVQIKEALLEVINIQENEYDPQELHDAQQTLNQVYDDFVAKNGFINDRANQLAFHADDQLPLLRSIETPEKGTNDYKKAMIFSEATIRPALESVNVTNAEEALIYSLNKTGQVDLKLMQDVYSCSEEKLIKELGQRIFFEPETAVISSNELPEILPGEWVTREAYLSGDVKSKLAFARIVARTQPEKFGRNVDALEDVQPTDLNPSEIQYSIGSTWIPLETYEAFMYDCFETSYGNRRSEDNRYCIEIEYSKVTSKWSIQGKRREPNSIRANKTFGSDRMNGYEIMEDCLNLQTSTVYDTVREYDGRGDMVEKRVVNPKETMIVRGKQQQLQEKFSTWLFAERDRSVRLGRLYNDRFNRIVPQKFDGSYLDFPNMSKELTLRPHQRNVVARIVQKKTALMAHEVGAGKTAAMIASGMFLKRIGTVQKPIFVVPNHLVDQWGMEFLRFFPGANVLVTSKKDFQKENRRTFTSKIATGNYDAIIIGQSQFERIPLSVERQAAYINAQINEIQQEIQAQKLDDGKRWTVKQMEGMKKKLTTSLDKLNDSAKKDNVIDFEKLGVDFLFVDEAHNYKNCFVYSKMQGVAGISQSSSQRASDMLMKCQFMQEVQDGGGVVFATGTPISNSMSEMYVMQRYLQPDALSEMSIASFDEWASTFGEVVASLEATPEGGGYKMKSRFAKFHNLPELMNLFSEVADIQTSDMLNLPVPLINGGQAEIIATEATPYQLNVMDSFVERADRIRTGAVDTSVDNMLKLTHEAKLLAIDPRLLDAEAPNDSESKLNTCVDNVYRIWEEHMDTKATQMIFCDSGTPKKDKFNVYDEVKRVLISKGIPENQVAFIHDAKTDVQREKLFQKVRDGDVRVLLGSTSKVGTGTNVQDRLIAGHHLDCPWRPSDIIQRDGRVVRQGNSNETVYMYRYVTKSTFDAYLWQIQEQKLSFISQVMTGKSISRDCADIDETVLSAAEVKAIATSNPLLAEKMTLDNEVTRLKILKGEWQNAKSKMLDDLEDRFPKDASRLQADIELLQKDASKVHMETASDPKKAFSIQLGDSYYDSRAEASKVIEELSFIMQLEPGETKKIGSYRGFDVHFGATSFQRNLLLLGEKEYDTAYYQAKGIGNIIKLENMFQGIPGELNKLQEEMNMFHKNWEDTKEEAKKPFAHEKELVEKMKQQNELNFRLEMKDVGNKEAGKQKEESVNMSQ